MYNSRPRVRRFTSEIEVPENYSGNAFREEPERENAVEKPVFDGADSIEADNAVKETAPVLSLGSDKKKGESASQKGGFGFDLSRFFGGGIGYEELLILGLILLVAQNEGNEDILLLLVLLLFVG